MFENEKYIAMKIDNSSCISGFKYDKNKKSLEVNFCHGGNFIYGDIEENLIREWIKSDSKGRFFNKYLRG